MCLLHNFYCSAGLSLNEHFERKIFASQFSCGPMWYSPFLQIFPSVDAILVVCIGRGSQGRDGLEGWFYSQSAEKEPRKIAK
jgi:hypothetical protein